MASEGTSERRRLGLKPDTKGATAMIAVPDEKCQSGTFSTERINGRRYLVASHSETKEWDSSKLSRSTVERIKTSGRSNCVSGAATNSALCDKSVSVGLRGDVTLLGLRPVRDLFLSKQRGKQNLSNGFLPNPVSYLLADLSDLRSQKT